MVERNRTAGPQGRGHTGSTGGFHPHHANLRGTLAQVGDDPEMQPPPPTGTTTTSGGLSN